jgi:C4-type Zn-finger protein
MTDTVMEASCPICLRADELPSMVPVELPHALLENMRAIVICRGCAFAIHDSIDGVERTPAPSEPTAQSSEGE